ncbi:TPA: hypothetical protein H5Q84_001601 [Escherichia coli]|nr:hypothetical protein [Escherichia coli]HAL1241749.1 hypothetical protein [Escherichia coli]
MKHATALVQNMGYPLFIKRDHNHGNGMFYITFLEGVTTSLSFQAISSDWGA